jgi:hypothetical protein
MITHILALLITVLLPSVSNAQITETGNYRTYPEGVAPLMEGAGSKIIDSTFNTTILKATDSNSVGRNIGCINSYSYVQTFNKDSTKMYSVCYFPNEPEHQRATLFPFDPVNFTVGAGTQVNNSVGCYEFWMWWSRVHPNIMYCNSSSALFSYNVDTQVFTLIKDLSSALLAGGNTIRQMYVSADDDVFSWFQEPTKGNTVWKRSTNQLLINQLYPAVDENYLDKSGRYFISGNSNGSPDVIDLRTMSKTTYRWGVDGWFHHDQGNGAIIVANDNGSATNLIYRSLATPHSYINLLAGTTPWTYGDQQDHFSMTAENNSWALASRYSQTQQGVRRPFDNEIVQIATDGSFRVRRIGHSFVKFKNYWDAPFANISPDGKFVAFSSNWGVSGGRHDVYVIKITPAPTGTGATTPIPPSRLQVK